MPATGAHTREVGRLIVNSSAVDVRLDDALSGRLPTVCCMTGARADGFAPLVVPRRLGVAWLLLLGGPFGALLLVALWPRLRVRYTVKLPFSTEAFDRMHGLRVRRLWCGWFAMGGMVLALALKWNPQIAMTVALAAFVSGVVSLHAHFRLPWTMPSAIADTRGRIVTLRGVHERFAVVVAQRSP